MMEPIYIDESPNNIYNPTDSYTEETDTIPTCSGEEACEIVQGILEEPVTTIEINKPVILEDVNPIGTVSVYIRVPAFINRQEITTVDLLPYYDAIAAEITLLQSKLETILSSIKDQL